MYTVFLFRLCKKIPKRTCQSRNFGSNGIQQLAIVYVAVRTDKDESFSAFSVLIRYQQNVNVVCAGAFGMHENFLKYWAIPEVN